MNPTALSCTSLFFLVLFMLLMSHTAANAQTFQYDSAGRLTAALYTSGASIRYQYDAAGNVTRVQHVPAPPPALPPDGVIDTPADDVTIEAGQSVDFTASGTDPDAAFPLAFRWDFDGGAADSNDEDPGPVVFDSAGTYTVELLVTDATGLADPTPDTVVVTVNATPAPPGGGGNTGGGDSGRSSGGGATLWLPLALFAFVVARCRRFALLGALLAAAGVASAQAPTWQPMASPTDQNLKAVWGFLPTEVYAVGDNRTFLEFDGQVWRDYTEITLPEFVNLTSIWGRSRNDLYVTATSGDPDAPLLFHYDGTAWAAIDHPEFAGLVDVWSAGPDQPLYVISGTSAWQLDAGLDPRVIGNWLRRGFTERTTGSLTASARLTAIGGAPRDVIMTGVAGGSATQPGAYRNLSRLTFFNKSMNDVYAFSDTEMVIVGDASYRLNGDVRTFTDWTAFTSMADPLAVWGSSPDNIYIAGTTFPDGLIMRFDGTASEELVRVPTQVFRDIHGFGPESAFAVGDRGLIYGLAAPVEQPTAANFPHSGWLNGYVNAFTGELVYETTDLTVGHHFPISFGRYYASNLAGQRTAGGALSRNWTHSYEWQIDVDDKANPTLVTVTDYRGREYEFVRTTTGWDLEPLYSANVSLVADGSGGYLFADLERELIYGFGFLDRLEFIEDRNGNVHRLVYISGFLASVEDNFGNAINLQYNNGRVAKVFLRGPDTSHELAVDFGYTDGFLTSATQRVDSTTQGVTTYSYSSLVSEPGLLASVATGGFVERVWLYDDQGRVSATALTEAGTFEYAYSGNQVTVRTPGGVERVLQHNGDGSLVSETDGAGGRTDFGYDSDGRLASITDRAGRTTTFSYEFESGLVRDLMLPGDRKYSRIIEQRSSRRGVPFYDVVQIVYPDSKLEIFETDEYGNTTRYRDRSRAEWLYEYDASGRVTATTNPGTGTTVYSHDARGAVETVTDDAGNVTRIGYERYRRPDLVQFADDSLTLIDWDGFRVSRIEDASGLVTDYAYDDGGRLTSLLRSDGKSVVFEYDGAGDIRRIVDNGDTTTYEYDAFRRLNAIVSPVGDRLDLTFDSANNLRQVTDGRRQDWVMQYHPDGVLQRLTRPGGSTLEIDNTFDPRGLDVLVTHGGEQTRYGHDDLGRVVSIIDRLERQTTIARNEDERRTTIAMPVADFTLDIIQNALGQIETITDAINGIWDFAYDAQGRRTATTDPANRTTAYEHDELNRVNKVTFADNITGTLQYALNGILSQADFSDGTSVALDTTPAGRIMGGTNLSLAYSAKGDLIDSNGIRMEHYPDGRLHKVFLTPERVIEYLYDGNGNATTIRDWLGGETTIAWTHRNQWDLVAYPNGVSADYDYLNGRLRSISYPSIGEVSLAIAANGQVQSVTRNLPGPTGIEALDLELPRNVASEVPRFSYDARGNRTSDDRHNYVFDPLNRLASYSVAGGQVTLEYDALGNIVRETTPDRNTEFVINYGLVRPQTMVERDGIGNDRWYYVFTPPGELLYRINADGQRQIYHFDQDGNTAFITDGAGAVIQTYFYSPAGLTLDESGSMTATNSYTTGGRSGAHKLTDSDIVVSPADDGERSLLEFSGVCGVSYGGASRPATDVQLNDTLAATRLNRKAPGRLRLNIAVVGESDGGKIFGLGENRIDSAAHLPDCRSPVCRYDLFSPCNYRGSFAASATEPGGKNRASNSSLSLGFSGFSTFSAFRDKTGSDDDSYFPDAIGTVGLGFEFAERRLEKSPADLSNPIFDLWIRPEADGDSATIPAIAPNIAPNPKISAPERGPDRPAAVDSIIKEVGQALIRS